MVDFLEPVVIFLTFIALGVAIFNVILVGNGTIKLPLVLFAQGIILFLLSRMFPILMSLHLYDLSDNSMQLWMHIFVYLFLISFIMGGIRLREMSLRSNYFTSTALYTLFIIISIIGSILILLTAQSLESTIVSLLENPVIMSIFMLRHLLTPILTAVAAFLAFQTKNDWKRILSKGAYPIIFFLSFISLQHLWENLQGMQMGLMQMETMPLAPDYIEAIIVMIALVFLIWSMYNVFTSLKRK